MKCLLMKERLLSNTATKSRGWTYTLVRQEQKGQLQKVGLLPTVLKRQRKGKW